MSDKKNTDPIVPPMQSDSDLKEYRCPHCGRFLFKGNVQKLNMVCHHCQKMIDVDESELRKTEKDTSPE
jgi:acetyl-CoA carboxylase beta subunit